jgi:putative spermidine/putrescine transport system permease protein
MLEPTDRPVISRNGVLLVLPAVVVLALLVAPLLSVLRTSFDIHESGGRQISGWSLDSYLSFLEDPVLRGAIIRTMVLSSLVTILTLLAAYPIALFIARIGARWRVPLLVLCIAPLLTADVVRVYGWLVLLGGNGLVNSVLISAGLVSQPPRLIFNETGTVIGLVEILMPYAILILFGTLVRQNRSLEEAARSLGAGHVRTFLRVTLPLSLPGIAAAAVIVLVLTASSYITPLVLGGGRVFLIATEVYRNATVSFNWPLASALSVLLVGTFAAAALVLAGLRRVGSHA